ncbi:MAG TPA: hypothetical protein VG142_08065 [Trebonia sp.]|jgi:hypothetical protein|nr:hypothetical protein [Trebonia sp.]
MTEPNDTDKYVARLALPGRPVVFRGEYAAVTAMLGTDNALTADIRRPGGGVDYRVFPGTSGFLAAIAECASIAAHGPVAPVCRSDGNVRCGHIQYGPLPDNADSGLPVSVAAAARKAADDLFQALSPAMATASPAPGVSALWDMVKMLSAVSGGLDFSDVPEAERHRAHWAEAASLASGISRKSLKIVAAGMTPQQASAWLVENDGSGVWQKVTAYRGILEMIPPDHDETARILTVTFDLIWHYLPGQPVNPPAVTSDQGPAPEPRPHTASTVLRAGRAVMELAAVLGELVIEPGGDGIPLCGRPGEEVTCEVCKRTVGADIARVVEARPPSSGQTRVCSVVCARAASAGDHKE